MTENSYAECCINKIATISIEESEISKKYNRQIYGGFLEHFDDQVYGGIYDPKSGLADENGFRVDVLEALKALKVPVIRWPGGCFVDSYNWQKGIGKSREAVENPRWGEVESNKFGTDEFIKLCRKLNAEPYICTNSNAQAKETLDWVGYCNSNDNKHKNLRLANGISNPYKVKYWCIGNEHYDKEYYIKVRETAKSIKNIDPKIKIICAGSQGDLGENENSIYSFLFEIAGEYIDCISVHNYWLDRGYFLPGYNYMDAIIKSDEPDNYIKKMIEILSNFGVRGKIKIAFDEWNLRAWQHPSFPRDYVDDYQAPEILELTNRRIHENNLASQYTMADALFSASFLNACLKNSEDIEMANIAPLINTRGPVFVHPKGIVRRPHYYALWMYSNLLQDYLADTKIKSGETNHDGKSIQEVDAIATVSKNGSNWSIAIINRSCESYLDCEINLKGRRLDGNYPATILTGDFVDSYNDIGKESRVIPKETEIKFNNGICRLKPHSLTIICVKGLNGV